MIKNLFILSSRGTFATLSRGWTMAFLIAVAIAMPFYQAFVFNLDVDSSLFLRIALSFLISLIFYFIAYGFGAFMTRLSKELYKTDIDSFLFILQVFLIAAFIIFYIEALLLPNWKTYDNLFNPHLVLLAVYYALGNYSYNRKLIPSYQAALTIEGEKFAKPEIIQVSLTLTLTIGILFGLHFQKVSSLKSELYERSVEALKTSETVSNILGNELIFSMIVKGDVGEVYGKLRYNLAGPNETSVINVEGKIIDGNWRIVKLTLNTPEKISPINFAPET